MGRFLARFMAVLAGVSVGCGDEDVFFRVDFSNDELRTRAVILQVEVREGGCDGTEVRQTWSLDRDRMEGEAVVLPDGDYGVVAHAVDDTCSRFASGCAALSAPTADDVRVLVEEISSSEYLCPGRSCSAGTCDLLDASPDPFLAIGAGGSTTCAIQSDGGLWCWGSNIVGQLGTGDTQDAARPTRIEPDRSWIHVDLGLRHQCAVDSNGEVFCAGENLTGSLGVGDREQRLSLAPIMVSDVAFRLFSTRWDHSLAIADDGATYSWGRCCQQLGVGPRTEDLLTPAAMPMRWTAVSAGGTSDNEGGASSPNAHSCGIQDDGSLWCWGGNDHGQLGVGDLIDRDSPTRVGSPPGPWASVVAGGKHTCAIRSDGTLWCWGRSANGALGTGGAGPDPVTTPLQLEAEGRWQAVASASRTTCGVQDDGSLWCWGLNPDMQLGQPDMPDLTASVTPIRAHPGSSWRTVVGGHKHFCAVDAEGNLLCWGSNGRGELGRGVAGAASPDAVVAAFP